MRTAGRLSCEGCTPSCQLSPLRANPLRSVAPSRRPDSLRTPAQATLSLPLPGTSSPGVPEGPAQSPRARNADLQRFLPSTATVSGERSVSLLEDGTRLTVASDGRFTFFEERSEDGSSSRVVARGSLHLPKAAVGLPLRVASRRVVQGRLEEAHLQWGPPEAPIAELRISPPRLTAEAWCKGLTHGFVLELGVSPAHGRRAEVSLELEESGHWFGGGHLIRQLWPLNHAALEVGPWYAFDNGPNGQNNLLGPHWMSSRGLLLSVDPDTPFLHIGMNAPVSEKDDGWVKRAWGVGIQNMSREMLPLSHASLGSRGRGDGLLRIQARSSYKNSLVRHPLTDWVPQLIGRGVAGGVAASTSSLSEDGGDEAVGPSGMLTARVALCATGNVKDAALMALKTLTPPGKLPSAAVLRAPIWTTWARYKTGVDQGKVLRYAREVAERCLQRSVMEVDDRWQSAYGDLSFDRRKFPDPKAMVDELHAAGFAVTLWVMPFVEEKSAAYREGAARGFFVQSEEGQAAGRGLKDGFFNWWNSPPVMALDVTNPEAVDWFVGRLRRLMETTGVDGFKFDAGEPCFLPPNPRTLHPLATPQDYTRLYISEVAGQFAGGCSEVRTGHQNQDVAVLTRMGDRFSTWDVGNGLQSIIPTLLTSGLLGYPFCLPDMIGGNAYFGKRPDSELLVRWAQANALMPAMQFSIAPWDLSRETEALVAAALEVRRKLSDVLLAVAEDAAHALHPICRPMWFLDPSDQATFTITDQFALGDHVVVAPVVTQGAVKRDVYLPRGQWRDLDDASLLYEGGQWLRDLHAPLSKLPCFIRVGATQGNLHYL